MAIPDNTQDIIDSRDVIARIEELRAEIEESMPDVNPEMVEELASLTRLADEASGYAADWSYGETLIRASYFVTYAQELADDLGYTTPDTHSWPFTCIDWERAALELQMDYTAVDFDGVTYWIR